MLKHPVLKVLKVMLLLNSGGYCQQQRYSRAYRVVL